MTFTLELDVELPDDVLQATGILSDEQKSAIIKAYLADEEVHGVEVEIVMWPTIKLSGHEVDVLFAAYNVLDANATDFLRHTPRSEIEAMIREE